MLLTRASRTGLKNLNRTISARNLGKLCPSAICRLTRHTSSGSVVRLSIEGGGHDTFRSGGSNSQRVGRRCCRAGRFSWPVLAQRDAQSAGGQEGVRPRPDYARQRRRLQSRQGPQGRGAVRGRSAQSAAGREFQPHAVRAHAGRCGGYRVHSKVDRRRLSGGRGGYPRARHTIAMAQDQRAAGPAPRRRLVRRSDDRMGGEQRRQYHQDHQRRRELDGAALVTRRVSALHRLCESVDRLGGNTDPASTAISYDGRRRQLVQHNESARQCAGQRVRPLGRQRTRRVCLGHQRSHQFAKSS